jgi:hypothetical protein
MGCVSAIFEFTIVDLQQQDLLRHGGTDCEIAEGAFDPKVARSRLARPTWQEPLFALVTPSRR